MALWLWSWGAVFRNGEINLGFLDTSCVPLNAEAS